MIVVVFGYDYISPTSPFGRKEVKVESENLHGSDFIFIGGE